MGKVSGYGPVRRSTRTKRVESASPYFRGTSSSDDRKIDTKLRMAQNEQINSLTAIKARIAEKKTAGEDTTQLEKMQDLIEQRKAALDNEITDRNIIEANKAPQSDIEAAKSRLKIIKATRRVHLDAAIKKAEERWEKHEKAAGITGAIKPCPQVFKNKDIGDVGEDIDTKEVTGHFSGTDAIVLTQIKATMDGYEGTLRFDYLVIHSTTGEIIAIGETKTNTADFTKNQKIFHIDKAPATIDISKNTNLPTSLKGKKLQLNADQTMVVMNRIIINNET